MGLTWVGMSANGVGRTECCHDNGVTGNCNRRLKYYVVSHESNGRGKLKNDLNCVEGENSCDEAVSASVGLNAWRGWRSLVA